MIQKVSVVLTIIIMVLGMTACGANAGQDTTDGTANVQAGDRTDIQGEATEPEDTSEARKEKAAGKDGSDVENGTVRPEGGADAESKAGGTEGGTAAENEAAGSEGKAEAKEPEEPENEFKDEKTGGQTEMKMSVQIGDYNFTATLESNTAVDELADMMKEGPVTINMDDFSGFEKVGALGRSLTASNSQTTTAPGDIVLYNSSNIVMFYGSNSWSYTRIGKIDDLTDWETALGKGSITAVFSIAE